MICVTCLLLTFFRKKKNKQKIHSKCIGKFLSADQWWWCCCCFEYYSRCLCICNVHFISAHSKRANEHISWFYITLDFKLIDWSLKVNIAEKILSKEQSRIFIFFFMLFIRNERKLQWDRRVTLIYITLEFFGSLWNYRKK